MALAKAFGVRRRQVWLVAGEKSRDKVVAFDAPAEDVAVRVAELRG